MTSGPRIAGTLFLLLGAAAAALTLFSDWLIPGQSLDIGARQLVATLPAVLVMGIGALLFWREQVAGKLALAAGGATTLVAAGMAWLAVAAGPELRQDLNFAPQQVRSKVVEPAGVAGTAICRCAPHRRGTLRLQGGFETSVAIYDWGGPGPRPGIVISHGNTWMGGNLAIYRVVATLLAKQGFIVLTFDYPGFGQSSDPFAQGPDQVAAAYDFLAHLESAVSYLIDNTRVDRNNVTVFGHSGGTNWALRAAAGSPDVARVAVMFTPPITPPAVHGNPDVDAEEYAAQRSEYFRRRFESQYRDIYGKDVPKWMSWELTRRDERFGDDVWDRYRTAGHKPFLLVLGERDQPDGQANLHALFESIAQPKQFLLLRGADHYLNTTQSMGLVFYDRYVARQLVDGLAGWVNESS